MNLRHNINYNKGNSPINEGNENYIEGNTNDKKGNEALLKELNQLHQQESLLPIK